jgi:hypothetical protein
LRPISWQAPPPGNLTAILCVYFRRDRNFLLDFTIWPLLLPVVSFNGRTSLISLWSTVAVDFSDPRPHPMTSMYAPLLIPNYLNTKALSKTIN